MENDFVQSPADHCVYTKQIGSKLVMMLIWRDDIIVAASDMELMRDTIVNQRTGYETLKPSKARAMLSQSMLN